MALKSTIYKVNLHLSDLDREYYNSFNLTIARHPSETELRLATRILAFVLHASDELTFGKGVSDEDEAALWQKNLHEEIELWIELGQPDEKRLKRASVKSKQAYLYGYQSAFDVWWQQQESAIKKFTNLSVVKFEEQGLQEFDNAITRTMELQITVQDGQLWLSVGDNSILIDKVSLQNSH